MRQADVIVIGAGVLGTFHAYFAAQRGCLTLLIERNAWPNDASTRNFGMIAESLVGVADEWAPCARATREIYLALQQTHDISVRVTGSLYLASTEIERTVLREFAQQAHPQYRCEYLERAEALARYPFVQESYCTGALLFPDDLTLEPRRMLGALIPVLVEQRQVEYLPHTTIVSVLADGGRCVVTDARGERYTAERVIVCGGAEYRTLFPERFRAAGMRICKLQMMQTAPQSGFRPPHSIMSGLSIRRYPAFTACPSHALLREQPLDEAIRANDIHLLLKQAVDGAIVIGDSHQYRETSEASALEEGTDPAINEAILCYAHSMLRLPSWSIAQLWNGYYAVHPQREVFSETIDEAIHIAGAGGKGMTLGPGFARQHIEALIR